LEHAKRHEADKTVIVAAGFAGGQLQSRAEQKGIRLLSVDHLEQLLQAHDESPLGSEDLLPLFEGAGLVNDDDMAAFAQRVEETVAWPHLLSRIYTTVWERQTESRARLDANALFFLLNEEFLGDQVEEAVAFLKTPILRALAVDSDGRLRTLCSPSVLRGRLIRLQDALTGAEDLTDDLTGSWL